MAEDTPNPLERIDRALDRIDAAIRANHRAGEALTKRHAALKARMTEAVSALDEVIAKGTIAAGSAA